MTELQLKKDPRNITISVKVSQTTYDKLKKYGHALKLGNGEGICTLAGIGASVVAYSLEKVEQELYHLGRKIDDLWNCKEQWYYRAAASPFIDLLKTMPTDEKLVLDIMIASIKSKKKEEKHGATE